MNFKKLSIICIVFLMLVLSIGAISAADDATVLETSQGNIDKDVVSADTTVVPESQSIINSDVKQTTEITTKAKIKTKVEADQVAVTYKKNKYFKVEVEDNDDELPDVKLNIKVGTGANAKTYAAKTNSYGIAKINTKNLKIGAHKVTITSADDRYEISKTSKIFVGKQYTATLKTTSKKAVLKNKDVVALKIINDFDEKDAKIVHKKAKSTKILKAKFYLKNKATGQKVVKRDNADFDDGRWEMPDVDYPTRFTLVKVKVYYISTK